MPRFSKGTTDHDSDGRMGGSRKGDATMSKKPRRSTRADQTPEAQPTKAAQQKAAEEQFAAADAASADDTRLRMAALGGL